MYVDGDQAYRPVRCVGVTMHRVQLSLLVTKRCLEGRMSLINLTPFAVYAPRGRPVVTPVYIYIYIYTHTYIYTYISIHPIQFVINPRGFGLEKIHGRAIYLIGPR